MILSIYFIISQDPQLRKLGNAVRGGACIYGFTDGLSKSVIWRMVDLVMEEGLCEKHQIRIHM